jgi:hypothetical protein
MIPAFGVFNGPFLQESYGGWLMAASVVKRTSLKRGISEAHSAMVRARMTAIAIATSAEPNPSA